MVDSRSVVVGRFDITFSSYILLLFLNFVRPGLHIQFNCTKGRLYSRMPFIYKYETATLNPFVKPSNILKLAIQNIFYVQLYMESAFTYNLGLTLNLYNSSSNSTFCSLYFPFREFSFSISFLWSWLTSKGTKERASKHQWIIFQQTIKSVTQRPDRRLNASNPLVNEMTTKEWL